MQKTKGKEYDKGNRIKFIVLIGVLKIFLYPLHFFKSITQVIDLLDRIRTCRLPFACENIIEVTHRNWLVLPAKIKNCKSSQRVEIQEDIEEDPQQKECDEIQTRDQIVLNEGEGHGKNITVNKILLLEF